MAEDSGQGGSGQCPVRNLFDGCGEPPLNMLAEVAETADPARQGLDDLMAGYQRADPEAAAELIRQVSPLLYRFLAASVGTNQRSERSAGKPCPDG